MRDNPVRLAWTVLLIASLVFCLLAAAIPLSIRYALLHAVEDLPATLSVTSGTVLVIPNGAEEPIAVVDSRSIDSHTLIQTDQSSQATLVVTVDGDHNPPTLATVQVYPNARVRLAEASHPRFSISSDPYRILLEVRSGRVRINTAELQPRGLYTEVITPHATAVLGPGSYSVDVSASQTQVASRAGDATVSAAGAQTLVTSGQRTVIPDEQPPNDPLPLPENLIVNGDFQEPLGPPTWLLSRYPDEPGSVSVEIVSAEGRNATRFRRLNETPIHTEVGITQVLDRSVQDFEQLVLQMDVLLRWQSLPGAGEQSSEFPLMVWVDYEDIYGNHQFWTHGFYYRDPPAQWVVTGGQKIQPNLWFPYESGNLFELLPMAGRPPPARINWIKIYASGHNYESLVSEVRLTGS